MKIGWIHLKKWIKFSFVSSLGKVSFLFWVARNCYPISMVRNSNTNNGPLCQGWDFKMVGGKEPAGVPMTHFYLKGNKQLVLHFLIYALPFKKKIFSKFIEFLAICGENLTIWILNQFYRKNQYWFGGFNATMMSPPLKPF